jgi:cell division protein FtsB
MEEKKEIKKEKKKVDMMVVLSVIVVTAIICIFNSWLYYDAKIEKIRESNEIITMKFKNSIDDLNSRNSELQSALNKFNEDIQKALEENK